jgi:hypothetical protein
MFYRCEREDPNRLRSGEKLANLGSAANAANAFNPTDANEPAETRSSVKEAGSHEALASGSSPKLYISECHECNYCNYYHEYDMLYSSYI